MHKQNKQYASRWYDIDVAMPMYNLIEYSDNHSRTSGILWNGKCNGNILDFNATTQSLKIKEKNNRSNRRQWHKRYWNNGSIKISKCFWRTLEMSLINCKISFDLNWSKNCVVVASNADQAAKFSITYTKLYVPVITLTTQDN